MNAVMRTITRIAGLVAMASLVAVGCSPREENQTPTDRSTVFEGARLITGDGSAPIEDSVFMVADGAFTAGRTPIRSAGPGRSGAR